MLQRIGFGETWVGWVQKNFDSGTTSVMLNGIPGKQFQCKRGVRQGDPLSPLLFVMAADLLQCIVNKARSQGLLTLPIEAGPSSNFPIIQYADDTILIMKASQRCSNKLRIFSWLSILIMKASHRDTQLS
jgi:hypothetical protein